MCCAVTVPSRVRVADSIHPSIHVWSVSETNETILRDGHGVWQAGEWGGKGFRRTVLEVNGAMRVTREAAAAAVQRAKRFFFRDAG